MPRRRAGRPAPSRQSRAVARGVSCDAACRCSSSNIGSNPLSPSSPYPWSSGGREASAPVVQERPQPRKNAESRRGRVLIVTGGATGLGRAVALEFAQAGCGVGFNYVEMPGREVGPQALLTETAIKALGVPCYSALCDVREMDLVEHFVGQVRRLLGGVHYLVNNAGVAHDGALWRLTAEAWSEVMDTNVSGAFNCIHAVAPHMRAQRFGKIVNVASHQAFRPGFGVANYAASKAALIGLTKAAAVGPKQAEQNPTPEPTAPLPTAGLAGQKVALTPLALVAADEALRWDSLIANRRVTLDKSDSIIAMLLTGRAPEVTWVGPPELRRIAHRAPGIVTDPDQMGTPFLRAGNIIDVPDPLRYQLRT